MIFWFTQVDFMSIVEDYPPQDEAITGEFEEQHSVDRNGKRTVTVTCADMVGLVVVRALNRHHATKKYTATTRLCIDCDGTHSMDGLETSASDIEMDDPTEILGV